MNECAKYAIYARNLEDTTLDRSYDYDHLGRLVNSHTGSNARAYLSLPGGTWSGDGPYGLNHVSYDVWGNITSRDNWGSQTSTGSTAYSNNRRSGFSYDAAGNLLNDLGQSFSYDATGQQVSASHGSYLLRQEYDGDTLRVKKVENSQTTYYLRSTVLGGQVVAEINQSGHYSRGYVYLGNQLIALQSGGGVLFVHQDPITKSQRMTDMSGAAVAGIELDTWGGETNRSWNSHLQPQKYTSYERDGNGSDEAMMRRYNRWHSRFDQPDPYSGSYNLSDPQSFNRYSYAQNDPVNFIDPMGLDDLPVIDTGPPVIVIGNLGAVGGLLHGFADFGGGTILDEMSPGDTTEVADPQETA
ncbi:MAG TPA: RHS repeat-associated core domain-containing protein [Pyrinomonadaceae bacterium]